MYVNCLNRLRYIPEVSPKLQKMHFLANLRIITQEGNMETRQMISFFSSTFSALTVSSIHFWIWKYWKPCSSDPPLLYYDLQNILTFGQKLPIWTAYLTSLESRHPAVTKNLHCISSIRRSQITIFLGFILLVDYKLFKCVLKNSSNY